jgi:hypothetical protein
MEEPVTVDIEYVSHSTVGPFDETEYSRFERWMQSGDRPDFAFDADYISHLRRANGGIPCQPLFLSAIGEEYEITRVFHFRSFPVGNPFHDSEVEVAYNQALSSGAFGTLLMPFANLIAGDMVCFDYRDMFRTKPSIVVWLHELSDQGAPATDFVADSFRDFVKMLYADDKK